MTRPTRYATRMPAADVAAALRFQAPAPPDMQTHSPDPGQAAEAVPEAPEARPGTERDKLLSRIVNARVPHRDLCVLIVQAEGLSAFTDAALTRMVKVLDAIESQ